MLQEMKTMKTKYLAGCGGSCVGNIYGFTESDKNCAEPGNTIISNPSYF